MGAGASYDFLRIDRHSGEDQYILNKWRPPLTKNIFDVARFADIIGNYDDIKQLASTIINVVDNNSNFDFEKYLSDQEAQFPEKIYPQITALRFYLAELFSKISYYFYRHANNHNHLIDQVNKRSGKALVVNFNYDTLFEKNIKTIGNGNVDNYVSGDIKVIKMHGAHNWRYTPKIDLTKNGVYDFFISGGQNLYTEYKVHDISPIATKSPDYSRENFDLNIYREYENNGFPGGRWLYYLPAIAIPIGTKGNHVCPKTHIDILTEQLKIVDRILVIGWKAQDEYLLSLLKTNLQNDVKLTIVSNGATSAKDYIEKFKSISQINPLNMSFPSNGYTNFMINGGIEKFLS